ncbi:hypothetical protein [Kribbella sp. NPDC003557]|uniref:hypothetical protein n=1 Tax=Kribbella sp. NPDC003557 TaxID=3154449 RepID=UPI0033AE63A6
MDEAVLRAARDALLRVEESGSPVVRADDVDEVLAVAVRRWCSYARRNPRRPSDLAAQIEDLAKGLRDFCEPDPALTGPLMEDYRHLATALAREFSVTRI